MQKFTIKKGTTSKILLIDIYDSSSTTGARLAGLVYNSAGLTAYYNREGAAGAATAITLATATKGTWATGGFIAIDATNMPGHYELHIPDAALATGANSVLVELKGATNMVPKTVLIELIDNVEADTYAIVNNGTYGNSALNTDLDTLITRIVGTLAAGTHNPQSGDTYAVVNHASYGNAQLVRSTTPANTLDVSATGEAGLDFNNVKDATGAHTLTNITVPTTTTLTNAPSDSSGVTTLLTRIASALTITTGKVDINDKTGFAVGTGGITNLSFAAGAIDAAATAADFTTEVTAGIRIKKNTALANFMFLMVDSTDHVTPKTGLTITATRSIDGAAFAACANAAAEVANGIYKISLAATDLNGDVIAFKFAGTGADARLVTVVTTT